VLGEGEWTSPQRHDDMIVPQWQKIREIFVPLRYYYCSRGSRRSREVTLVQGSAVSGRHVPSTLKFPCCKSFQSLVTLGSSRRAGKRPVGPPGGQGEGVTSGSVGGGLGRGREGASLLTSVFAWWDGPVAGGGGIKNIKVLPAGENQSSCFPASAKGDGWQNCS
jgi:hypothetical protein